MGAILGLSHYHSDKTSHGNTFAGHRATKKIIHPERRVFLGEILCILNCHSAFGRMVEKWALKMPEELMKLFLSLILVYPRCGR